jgi:hypothetical protein
MICALRFILLVLVGSVASSQAATTINSNNRFAYGANLGWIDWRGDTNNGAVIGDYVSSGYIYSANVGWINLGNNAPTNGIRYQNLSANDFGVNHDGFGNLRGYAYGANIGWIDFENNGAPTVDLKTGKLNGYVYSANCGWISLSNAFAYVQTDSISPGTDSNSDGLPDAWELTYFGTLGVSPGADADGDGMSNLQEYLAGTNPIDTFSNLRITAISTLSFGSTVNLTWTSVSNRCYYIQEKLNLTALSWFDSGLSAIPPDFGTTTTRTIVDTKAPSRFYRVEAFRPLTP